MMERPTNQPPAGAIGALTKRARTRSAQRAAGRPSPSPRNWRHGLRSNGNGNAQPPPLTRRSGERTGLRVTAFKTQEGNEMFEVTVTNGLWLKAGEEKIVRRIAEIAIGKHAVTAQKDDGSKWSLDVHGNDWWTSEMALSEGGRTGTLRVNFRYGGGGNAAAMDALQTWLNWVFK